MYSVKRAFLSSFLKNLKIDQTWNIHVKNKPSNLIPFFHNSQVVSLIVVQAINH